MRRVLALPIVVLLAGCGGGDGGGDSPRSLEAQFAKTRMTPDLRGGFEYGDTKYLRDTDKLQLLVGYGSVYFRPGTGDAGFDPLKSDVGLSIGTPPHRAARAEGGPTDSAKVKAALIKAGAKPGTVAGESGLVWGDEGAMHPEAQDAGAPGITGEYDRTLLDGDTVIAGRFEAEVAALNDSGDGDPLLDDPVYKGFNDCLGDVAVAVGGTGDDGSFAAGVRRPKSAAGPVEEVFCAVGGDLAAQETNLRRFEEPTTLLPSNQRPVSELWPEVTVERKGDYVRMVLVDSPATPAGSALTAFDRREFIETETPAP